MNIPFLFSAVVDNFPFSKDEAYIRSIIQEISVTEYDPMYEPQNQIHDRVDVNVVYPDPEKVTSEGIYAITYGHYHRQQRQDNWGVRVYYKRKE